MPDHSNTLFWMLKGHKTVYVFFIPWAAIDFHTFLGDYNEFYRKIKMQNVVYWLKIFKNQPNLFLSLFRSLFGDTLVVGIAPS